MMKPSIEKMREIEQSEDIFLLAEDVARAIGVAPQNLREQAKDEPHKLGFNVIVVGTSIKIPRVPFLEYVKGRTNETYKTSRA